MGLSTSEETKSEKYNFVIQRGNWKKLHIWKDVGTSPNPEEAKKILAEHRAKDFKHPYRCVRYLIFNLPKYQTLTDYLAAK